MKKPNDTGETLLWIAVALSLTFYMMVCAYRAGVPL